MVGKGNLAIFEGSDISETGEVTTHQNWCACMSHESLYLYEFFEPISDRLNFLMTMDYSPWSKREIWPFLRGSSISETEEAHAHQNWCVHI